MKVKIIGSDSSADLQVELNEFLANKDIQVIDIKFTSHATFDDDYIRELFVAYITYLTPEEVIKRNLNQNAFV